MKPVNLPLFTLLIQFVLPSILLAQTDTEVISSIRDRYYAVTGNLNNLQTISIDKTDYFLENRALTIIKSKYKNGFAEFYYSISNDHYNLYFIYVDNSKQTAEEDIRIYLDENEYPVLIKLDQNEVDYFHNRNLANSLLLEANNQFNKFFNLFEVAKNLKFEEIEKIKQTVTQINSERVRIDTLEFIEEKDEGYYSSGSINYLNSNKEKIKSVDFHAGEHGSGMTTTYFDNNAKICAVYEGTACAPFCNLTIKITYFERGRIEIRTDTYENKGIESSRNESKGGLTSYSLEGLVPRIEYK